MGYDRGDSFPFDFEPNVNPFGSKSKGKLPSRSYHIHCERKWKHSFLSVRVTISHATLRITVCSNCWREPIKCRVEWKGVSYWFSSTVAVKKYTESSVAYYDL